MTQTCSKCGETIGEGKKFCPACGAKADSAPNPQIRLTLQTEDNTPAAAAPAAPTMQQAQPEPAPAPVRTPPPAYNGQAAYNEPPRANSYPPEAKPMKGSKYAPVSTIGYIFMMIGMSLPLIGFILTLILAFAGGSVNRQHFARAVLFFMILGIIGAIVISILFWSTISQLTKNINIEWGL